MGQLERANDVVVQGLFALAQDGKISSDVRRTAAYALGQLGKKEPHLALALLELASDKHSDVRDVAYDALKDVVGNLG